ncbi:MAG: class I SAM-dependent methyltransferase [Sphingomonas sp.]
MRRFRRPDRACAADEAVVHGLLLDRDVDPRWIERAGWQVLRDAGRVPAADAAPEVFARWLEADGFARDLLGQTQLTLVEIERPLTALRRWLLLERRHGDFPDTAAALIAQAGHHGGTWLFDALEEDALSDAADFAAAYLPPLPGHAAPDHADPVTRAVAAQYAGWPYPVWQRAMRDPPGGLDRLRADHGLAPLADGAHLLVAGCGTGREAQRLATDAPGAQVTGIDLSPTSLAYARERCDAPNLTLCELDLHRAGEVGPFDHIASSGVLHHLADPEAGWAALAAALKPGGTMRVMLYSRFSRMQVRAARARIADLVDRPVTPALVRDVRARFIDEPDHPIVRSVDFHSMGGVHDLLLHAHEDAFDLPRIGRALAALGLDLLQIDLPGRAARDAWLTDHPDDPHLRDLAALHAWEIRNPRLFNGMYPIWCAKRR